MAYINWFVFVILSMITIKLQPYAAVLFVVRFILVIEAEEVNILTRAFMLTKCDLIRTGFPNLLTPISR